MNGSVEKTVVPAEALRLRLEQDGPCVKFAYDVDTRFVGFIKVTHPFDLDSLSATMLQPIGLGIAIFLGQLCLARRIELAFPVSREMVDGILPLAEMLYDVRCWKDSLDLLPLPEITYPDGSIRVGEALERVPRRACLLWSGGKDSTLSALVLERNGYDVWPLHITANARMEQAEHEATMTLAEHLGLRFQTLHFEFPQYLELSRAYANTWDQFPHYNSVAFGRDLALALLACPAVWHQRASHISMGHEHDCKTTYLTYQDKIVPRNDVESTKGALALERYIQEFILPGVRATDKRPVTERK